MLSRCVDLRGKYICQLLADPAKIPFFDSIGQNPKNSASITSPLVPLIADILDDIAFRRFAPQAIMRLP